MLFFGFSLRRLPLSLLRVKRPWCFYLLGVGDIWIRYLWLGRDVDFMISWGGTVSVPDLLNPVCSQLTCPPSSSCSTWTVQPPPPHSLSPCIYQSVSWCIPPSYSISPITAGSSPPPLPLYTHYTVQACVGTKCSIYTEKERKEKNGTLLQKECNALLTLPFR